jgi:hypothetical protein
VKTEPVGVRVSIDGKGRWLDYVLIERLWRSVKHKGVYMWAPRDMHVLERLLERWFANYNQLKPQREEARAQAFARLLPLRYGSGAASRQTQKMLSEKTNQNSPTIPFWS